MKKVLTVDMSKLNDQEMSEVIGILSRQHPGDAADLTEYEHTINMSMEADIPEPPVYLIDRLWKFSRTKSVVPASVYNKCYDDEVEFGCNVYVYGDSAHLEHCNDGKFHCVVGNKSFCHEELEKVEEFLWDNFAKHESDLTDYDKQEDLHDRSRDFMANFPKLESASLDEFMLMHKLEFSKKEWEEGNYLVEEFHKV